MNITNLLTDNNISDVCETQINIEVLELMNKDLALDLKNEANLGTKNIENTSDIAKINDEKSINLELGGNSNSSDGEDNNKTKDNEITIKNLTVNDLILRQNKNTIYYLPEEHNLRIRSRVYDFSSLKECIVSEDVDNIRTCSDKEFFKFYNDNQFYKSERCFEVSNFLNFCTFDNFVEFARRNNIRTVEDYHRYYIYFFYESKVIMFLNKDYYTGYLKGIALVEAHTQNRYKKDSIIPTIDAASSISIKEEKDIQKNDNVDLLKKNNINFYNVEKHISEEQKLELKSEEVNFCSSEIFLEFIKKNNIETKEDFLKYLIFTFKKENIFFVNADYFFSYIKLCNIKTKEDFKTYIQYLIYNFKVSEKFQQNNVKIHSDFNKLSYQPTTNLNVFNYELPFFRIGVSSTMQAIVKVHHYIFHFIISIVFFVTWFIFLTIRNYGFNWCIYFINRKKWLIYDLNVTYLNLFKDLLKDYEYIYNYIKFFQIKNKKILTIYVKFNYLQKLKIKFLIFINNYLNLKNNYYYLNLKYLIIIFFLNLDYKANKFFLTKDFFKLNTFYFYIYSKDSFTSFEKIYIIIYKYIFSFYFHFIYCLEFLNKRKKHLVFFYFIFNKKLNKKYTDLFNKKALTKKKKNFYVLAQYLKPFFLFLEKFILKYLIIVFKIILKILESFIIKKEYAWNYAAFFNSDYFEHRLAEKNNLPFTLSDFFYVFHDFSLFLKKKYFYTTQDFLIIKDYFIYEVERKEQHSTKLEVIWTIIPSIILCIIALPSFILLYAIDGSPTYEINTIIKVIGHQWYWEYQYLNNKNESCKFDSYMLTEGHWSLAPDTFYNLKLRLLDTNSWLKLPTSTTIKFLITSVDVIHSWAVPSFGIKLDGIPGRLNQVFCNLKFPGIFYGQCSELCGVNHGFMPIKIQVFEKSEFNLKAYLFEKHGTAKKA